MQSQQSFSTKWNLSKLFKNDNDEQIFKERLIVEKKFKDFIDKWKEKKEYLNDPVVLKTALDEYEILNHDYGTYGKEIYYFFLRSQIDVDSAEIKSKYNAVISLNAKLENEIEFFTYSIAKIDKNLQSKFLNYEGLKKYKHYLEILFAGATYLLDEEVEKVLNLKSKTSYLNWIKMTSSFLSKETSKTLDADGKETTKAFEEIISLLNNKNKKVRDSAANSFNKILKKHIEVGENELNSILENKKIDDDLRKIERPDKLRHLSDDIETEAVDKLVKAVSSKYSISARFYKLKTQLLNQEKLAYHERNIEYGEIRKEYSYDDSVKLVKKVFENLDSEFASIFNSFIKDGLVDVYPSKGKRGGAFCAHQLIISPTYILLNHSNQLHDVLTLAHESGHGINNELIKNKQNALNFGTPTSTAEVASTFMEDFVLQELLKTADDEVRLSLLMTKLNSDISTIFRQIAAYQFEQNLHEEFRKKSFLSKDEIGTIFQKHMSAYMGPYVEQSKDAENWWLYWIHIRYFFYNYSYASGLLISKALQASVKKDKNFINKVKEFLSAGRSESPYAIFQKLGVNINNEEFWLQGLSEVESLLKQTEELAKKLNKI